VGSVSSAGGGTQSAQSRHGGNRPTHVAHGAGRSGRCPTLAAGPPYSAGFVRRAPRAGLPAVYIGLLCCRQLEAKFSKIQISTMTV
jgi:hypothetical protein